MNFKPALLKSIMASLFVGVLFTASLPAMADMEAKTASPNLGNTPMEGTETFKAFGGKEGLVKIMDDFMIGLIAEDRKSVV